MSARLDITLLCSTFHTFSLCLSLPAQGRARWWGFPAKAMIKSSTRMPTGFPDMRGYCVAGRAMAERCLGGVAGGGEGRGGGEKREGGRHTHCLSSPWRDGIRQDWERCKAGAGWWWVRGWWWEWGRGRGWKVPGMKGRQKWEWKDVEKRSKGEKRTREKVWLSRARHGGEGGEPGERLELKSRHRWIIEDRLGCLHSHTVKSKAERWRCVCMCKAKQDWSGKSFCNEENSWLSVIIFFPTLAKISFLSTRSHPPPLFHFPLSGSDRAA